MNAAAENQKKFWGPGKTLALIFAGALVLRVLLVLTRQMIQLDETAYVRMAENLASGNGLLDITGLTSTHFSPLLPFFIAGVAAIVRNFILAAYIVVVVFGALVTIPGFLLGKEMGGNRVGLALAALLAVTPVLVDNSTLIYTESLYVFFLLIAIVFGRHMLLGCRIPCGTLAGGALGLAYLDNPSAVFYFVALLLLALAVAWRRGIWRQMGKALLFFAVFFLVYAIPYVVFLHAELGKWTYSGKSPGNIYTASRNLRAGTLDWEKDLMSLVDNGTQIKILQLQDSDDPASSLIHSPVQGARIFIRQSYIFYNEVISQVFPLWLLPLLGLGLFAQGWSRRRAAAVGYLLIMMIPALLILTMYAYSRFFIPFVPLVMLWVAHGWLRLEDWGAETVDIVFQQPRSRRYRRWAPWVIGAAVLLPLLLYSVANVVRQSYPVGYKYAGELIRQEDGSGHRIMSREYSAAYYAGGTAVMLPYADYEATTRYARLQHVDFLVIRKQELLDWRPTLARLLGDASQHPEWALAGTADPGTSGETLIFRLVPATR